MDTREMLEAVWADSLDGVVVADPSTVILDVNPAYCQLTGYRREQLVGQKTNVIRSGLTPRTVFTEMWSSLASAGKWVGELINERPDGSYWISFLSVTRILGAGGEVAGYVGIARDLTDRRQLEDQLRLQSTRLAALLESIATAVAMLDPDGRLVVANDNLARLLDCEVIDLLGQDQADLHRRLRACFPDHDFPGPTEPVAERMLATSGLRRRYFSFRLAPVVSAGGAELGKIYAFRDVTRETEVDRMKSEFIATVSHELRTPMTSIKGALGLLLGGAAGAVGPEQQELLTIAQSNIDRLIRLINDILDLSRIESGRLELRPTAVNLNDIVIAAARELEGVRAERAIELLIDADPMLAAVRADPDRVGQVLINLLGNAFKFSERGSRVTVTTRMAGRVVQVQVADNGPGIPPDQLESIFARFERASSPASRKAGGTGLGLAIARAIIEEHGGRIWAESKPGAGATFTFTLPLADQRA